MHMFLDDPRSATTITISRSCYDDAVMFYSLSCKLLSGYRFIHDVIEIVKPYMRSTHLNNLEAHVALYLHLLGLEGCTCRIGNDQARMRFVRPPQLALNFRGRRVNDSLSIVFLSARITTMSANEGNDVDPTFNALPPRLRKRIDRALNRACEEELAGTSTPRKRRRIGSTSKPSEDNLEPGGFLAEDSPAPGGFLPDDEDQPIGGGFLPEDAASSEAGGFVPPSASVFVDDDETDETDVTHIPLHLIPRALQLLDLQPDDQDVLDVFRNAASGWGSTARGSRIRGQGEQEMVVSRKDWRAVCAALLDTSAPDEEDGEESEGGVKMDVDESETSEEEYVGSDGQSEDPEEDDSEDEYQEGGFVRSTPQRKDKGKGKAKAASSNRKTRSRKTSYSSESSEGFDGKPRQLTARQKAECRRTFALFFPDVSETDLDDKRIMIKDIARVADLLKEKITAQEVCWLPRSWPT